MKRVRGVIERWWERSSNRLNRVLAHLTPVIAFVLIAMAYYLGIRTERTGFVAEVLDPNLKRITQPVLNAFRGRPPVVHRLTIRITQERLDSLMYIRENALEDGWLHAEDNPRFPVHCIFGKYEFDAVLNLRDGPAEELALIRWPFQLRLHNGDTLFTMQSFDLAPVHDISALHTWLFHQALIDQGHPAFGHAMLEFSLNKNDLGLYTLEGRVDSTLMEKWGRGRGPVMRFDDALLAGTRAAMENRLYGSMPPPQGDWLVAPLIAARNAVMLADPITAERYANAVEQLEDLRTGRVKPSEIMDIEALAELFALCDVLGGQEATSWWNLRFLADSISERLIAIPQHGYAGRPIETLSALQLNEPLTFRGEASGFKDKLFNDSIFYRHYIADLDTFSREGWIDSLMLRVNEGIAEREQIITAEYPQEVFDRNVFQHNRTVIEQSLRPRDLVLAYTQSAKGDQRKLALANVHALPIRATAVIIGLDTFPLARPITLLPRELDKPLTYTVVNTRIPRSEGQPERILVHVLGLSEMRSSTIRTWSTFVAQ